MPVLEEVVSKPSAEGGRVEQRWCGYRGYMVPFGSWPVLPYFGLNGC